MILSGASNSDLSISEQSGDAFVSPVYSDRDYIAFDLRITRELCCEYEFHREIAHELSIVTEIEREQFIVTEINYEVEA